MLCPLCFANSHIGNTHTSLVGNETDIIIKQAIHPVYVHGL